MKEVTIIGAGLAGSEAAWQIAKQGVPVRLIEMRPKVKTPAHQTDFFAELVCSNSFRGAALTNAVGLLKEESRLLDSFIMNCADQSIVPAGGALAVDRDRFSELVTNQIKQNPLIKIEIEEITVLEDFSSPVIVATGPLTSPALSKWIETFFGQQHLAFFDAISPILSADSLDFDKLFRCSRYGKGDGDDYLNSGVDKEKYFELMQAIKDAPKYTGNLAVENDCPEQLRPFEGCMPIEDMVERGLNTPRFGPLKPKGLIDPKSEKNHYAVLQLRQDNLEGTLWSLVGMQTRMKRAAQEEVFRSFPGLENAEFVRHGSVHRNTFINSPQCLNSTLETKKQAGLFFAGQVTGVEGYVESTACGLIAGINAARRAKNLDPLTVPVDSAIGALLNYISSTDRKNFQPMNISFGLIPYYFSEKFNRKFPKDQERRLDVANNALGKVRELFSQIHGL